jgi:hypothetical protein
MLMRLFLLHECAQHKLVWEPRCVYTALPSERATHVNTATCYWGRGVGCMRDTEAQNKLRSDQVALPGIRTIKAIEK